MAEIRRKIIKWIEWSTIIIWNFRNVSENYSLWKQLLLSTKRKKYCITVTIIAQYAAVFWLVTLVKIASYAVPKNEDEMGRKLGTFVAIPRDQVAYLG